MVTGSDSSLYVSGLVTLGAFSRVDVRCLICSAGRLIDKSDESEIISFNFKHHFRDSEPIKFHNIGLHLDYN